MAQGHAALEKRLGAGDAPPKDADSYSPELPQGVTVEQLKSDPLFAGFLKGAHAAGMTNKQVGYAISQFQERMQLLEQQRNSPEVAEAELSKLWKLPGEMEKNLSNSYRAAHAFASDKEHVARLEKKFGNDPDFIQLMAKIGGELGEDRPPAGITQVEQESLESLMKSPAYLDKQHPEHAVVMAKTRALYAKKYPG